jgi:hypothetical protein
MHLSAEDGASALFAGLGLYFMQRLPAALPSPIKICRIVPRRCERQAMKQQRFRYRMAAEGRTLRAPTVDATPREQFPITYP